MAERAKKSSKAFLWIVLALALSIIVFVLYRCEHKEKIIPPAPPVTAHANEAEFYEAFVKSLDYLVKAKTAFHQGQEWMKGVPESLPETSSTETLPQSPLFKAATQFALALEQFKYAEGLVKSDDSGPVKGALNGCREQYLQALERYQSTAKLYNEHAKAKYQEEDKSEKFALSDANARWAMAEKLTADFLLKGCDGELFTYLQEQKPEIRSAVLAQYQKVLGTEYDKYRVPLESQMGVATGETSPAPTRVPVPSP